MTEERESIGALLRDETLLRRVLEKEPSLVSRIVSHAVFLEALFSRPEALHGLLRAHLVQDDYQFEQLLASVGGDGTSLQAPPSGEEARLLHMLTDAEALGRLLRKQPELAMAIAKNPAFVEQVKVRKPHFYRALLYKAQERFGKDAELVAEIRAERESLAVFNNEGGKKEMEAERREREAREEREAGENLLYASRKGHTDYARALLERGADPNYQDVDGRTGLIFAARCDHPDVVRVLLEGGANPMLEDCFGRTARRAATSHNVAEMLATAERKQDGQDGHDRSGHGKGEGYHR